MKTKTIERMPLSLRGALVCAICFLAGLAASRVVDDRAYAEVRKTTPRAAFLSGSERSEQWLREISQTLKTMDQRLERIEKIAARAAEP